jgi:hypothetical protein
VEDAARSAGASVSAADNDTSAAPVPEATDRERVLTEALHVLTTGVTRFQRRHPRVDDTQILFGAMADAGAVLRRASVPAVVSEVVSLRPVVAAFAQAMERALLAANDAGSWRSDTLLLLIERVRGRTEGLVGAGLTTLEPAALLLGAAQLASAALMLADAFGAFSPPRKPGRGGR